MKKLLVMVFLAVVMLYMAGCAGYETTSEKENRAMKNQQTTLFENQPPPEIEWSNTRQNAIERINRFNDPNKVSYIYLLADNGVIIAFFPVKGTVSSLNTYLTPMQQSVAIQGGGSYHNIIEAPDELGMYGPNRDGIYFFLTDGTYMEWSGNYLLCDSPIKLSQQPIMTYSID